MFFRSFFSILFIKILSLLYSNAEYEWRMVETLAEENPFIVALINSVEDYVCSGTIIDKRTVLTTGNCITKNLTYVAVGLAVISKKNFANLLDVADTRIHADYTYLMNTTDPSLARIHSNIGLVFVVEPVLTQFLPPATIGSYFASELTDTDLTTVGHGRCAMNQEVFVLQYQSYEQTVCANPRWYYCICGKEVVSSSSLGAPTHGKDFGNGAPILHGSDVVCLSAISSGEPILWSAGVKYNIFTVIGAYVPWMEKTEKAFRAPRAIKHPIIKLNKRINRKRNKAQHHFDNDRTQLCIVFIFLVVR